MRSQQISRGDLESLEYWVDLRSQQIRGDDLRSQQIRGDDLRSQQISRNDSESLEYWVDLRSQQIRGDDLRSQQIHGNDLRSESLGYWSLLVIVLDLHTVAFSLGDLVHLKMNENN